MSEGRRIPSGRQFIIMLGTAFVSSILKHSCFGFFLPFPWWHAIIVRFTILWKREQWWRHTGAKAVGFVCMRVGRSGTFTLTCSLYSHYHRYKDMCKWKMCRGNVLISSRFQNILKPFQCMYCAIQIPLSVSYFMKTGYNCAQFP